MSLQMSLSCVKVQDLVRLSQKISLSVHTAIERATKTANDIRLQLTEPKMNVRIVQIPVQCHDEWMASVKGYEVWLRVNTVNNVRICFVCVFDGNEQWIYPFSNCASIIIGIHRWAWANKYLRKLVLYAVYTLKCLHFARETFYLSNLRTYVRVSVHSRVYAWMHTRTWHYEYEIECAVLKKAIYISVACLLI